MRFKITATAILMLALGACGQGGGSGTASGSAGGAASSTAPTAAQKALLASLPAAYQSADLANGEAHFGLCRACHNAVAGGADMTGPNLHGVFGRHAGTKAGFAYSAPLKASGIVWDAASLDKWLTNPMADVPGTKMSFAGIADANDRRDTIAYLKVASETP